MEYQCSTGPACWLDGDASRFTLQQNEAFEALRGERLLEPNTPKIPFLGRLAHHYFTVWLYGTCTEQAGDGAGSLSSHLDFGFLRGCFLRGS